MERKGIGRKYKWKDMREGGGRSGEAYAEMVGMYIKENGRIRNENRMFIESLIEMSKSVEKQYIINCGNRKHMQFLNHLNDKGVLIYEKGGKCPVTKRWYAPSIIFKKSLSHPALSKEVKINRTLFKKRYNLFNKFIYSFNKQLGKTIIDWPMGPVSEIKISTRLNKEEDNGRIYTYPFLKYGADTRAQLLFNNEEVVEEDFTSLHPSLLYRSLGLTPPNDCYKVSYERKIAKKTLLIIINSKSRASATKALLAEFRWHLKSITDDHETKVRIVEAWLDEIIMVHSLIKQYFFSGIAIKLMRIDSELCLRVCIEYMKKHNSLIIPIHDSFIIIKKNQKYIKRIMEEELEKVDYSILFNKNDENVLKLAS